MIEKKPEPKGPGPEPDVPASERQCGCKGECCCSSRFGGNSPGIPSHDIEIYKVLADLFNSEETAFWARNNILVIVQVGLIAATASFAGNADKFMIKGACTSALAGSFFGALLLIAIVGLATAVAWLLMVHRSSRIADTISSELKYIERKFPKDLRAFRVFGYKLRKPPRRRSGNLLLQKNSHYRPNLMNSLRLSAIWSYVGMLFLVIWIVLLIVIGFGLHGGALAQDNCATRDAGAMHDRDKDQHKDADKDAIGIGGGDPQKPQQQPQQEQPKDQAACPVSACPQLMFQRIGTIGPFCFGKHSRQVCRKDKPEGSAERPDLAVLGGLVARIHDAKPVQLTLVGSADRINLKPALIKKYGSNTGLARARAEWVLAQLKTDWLRQYPAEKEPVALAQAQVLSVGPAGIEKNAVEEDDRMVYVYILVQDAAAASEPLKAGS